MDIIYIGSMISYQISLGNIQFPKKNFVLTKQSEKYLLLLHSRVDISRLTLKFWIAGFYYFIFSNENEITSNFVAANFDLHKTVFDVGNSQEDCSNTTDCSLPLTFFSMQHVVIEVGHSYDTSIHIK